MRQVIKVNFEHPANLGILRHLRQAQDKSSLPKRPASVSPDDVEDPYARLGTHSDVVMRLWGELGAALPDRCAWVVYGTPVLVQPASGIIFAFGGGSHTYALRLPPVEFAQALQAGAAWVRHYPAYPYLNVEASVLDLSDFGPGWVFGQWLPSEPAWCLAAYRYAQEQEATAEPGAA